ncbi:MAG: hypothetical protein QOE36_2435 [Gaiellaceae bacterium]|nr:hypothetical protein [Gaiellaceae bacterium]
MILERNRLFRSHTETVIVEPERRAEARNEGVAALADAVRELVELPTLTGSLRRLVTGAVAATGADVGVVRVLDPGSSCLVARAAHGGSDALVAELEGSRIPLGEVPEQEVDDLEDAPLAVRRAAERADAEALIMVPVAGASGPVATLELFRCRGAFDDAEHDLARLAAAQAGLVLRVHGVGVAGAAAALQARDALVLAGDALAAGADVARSAEQVARLAAEATGARATVVWSERDDALLEVVASFGLGQDYDTLVGLAAEGLRGREPVLVAHGDLPTGATTSAVLQLGQPPIGVLQLLFDDAHEPPPDSLGRLATFAVRAAYALREGARSRTVAAELDRTRALVAVVGQAIAQLSLAHTLETAVERIAELLDTEGVAVYLREDGRLAAAADRGLAGPHTRVAERLLDLALGPFRGRGMLVVASPRDDSRLSGVQEAVNEAGIEGALAVPLLVRGEVIGLLAVYPARGRELAENDQALLLSLGSQLAVAVQNAQLHERAKKLGAELEGALASERQAARQLGALYEISRSFAQSLSLDATVETLAHTVVELLGVDAALIRMPDERGETLLPVALHVADPRLAGPVETILSRPLAASSAAVRRLYRTREPLVLDPESARALGPPHDLLAPFLEKGSTCVLLPIATPSEVLATLKILSLHPERPITGETIELALSIAGQAALALDNARLYQQQKAFADTMQRSLLPRYRPELEGIDFGAVYESSAHVEIGGDVYDFLELEDGRLAVVLGDVTGHGIDAAADMAMAKFTFRSLAREHPEPGDLLAAANDVVTEEIAPGKFITMSYVVVAPDGLAVCACAGHPPPRLVADDGVVRGFDASGLALGIEPRQHYDEVREQLTPGSSVVLYTDGVIEARTAGELYGVERLDELLARRHDLPAEELARAVVDDCRAFADGELADDVAVVVIKIRG